MKKLLPLLCTALVGYTSNVIAQVPNDLLGSRNAHAEAGVLITRNANNDASKVKTHNLVVSKSPEWYYIRPDKTGIAGDYHYTLNGDRFGNVWMGGFMIIWEQGSVVRYDGNIFTDWGSYDGYLPDARVRKIAFDLTDRLWVGTDHGIATYDNTKWTQYTTANSALKYDQVTGMAADKNNNMWITASGFGGINVGAVSWFNGTSWVSYTTSNSGLPTPNVRNIAVDKNNIKWMASDKGLIKFDGVNWTVYNHQNSGLSGSSTSDVEIDSLNRVWCVSNNTIDIFDGTKWSHVSKAGWPPNFNSDQLFIRGKKIILTDVAYTVLTYNGSNWQTHYTDNLVFDDYIDKDGNFWTAGIGFISKYDGTEWKNYTRYNTGLAEYFNEDVFVDANNNKWFANGNGGIQVFDCPAWEVYGPWNGGFFPIPETFSTIGTSVIQDSHGDIWMTYDGTYGYAVQIPGGDYSNYGAWKTWSDTNTRFPLFQSIQEAEPATNDKVFFRTWAGNIFMYDHASNKWTQFLLGADIKRNPFCMGHDNKGNLYLGEDGQIQIYKKGVWSTINLSSVGITYVFDIAFDPLGNMWLATQEGAWRYDGRIWTNWNRAKDGIAADHVSTIKIANNKVYIGAYNISTWPYYGGISIFNGRKWTTFLEGSSPLPHKQVEGLSIDTLGNLWILAQSEAIAVYRPGGVLGLGCIDTSLQMGAQMVQAPPRQRFSNAVSNNELSIFPNPAKDYIIINVRGWKNTSINIYDLSGKLVQSKQTINANQLKLNVTSLKPGVYMLRIFDEAGHTQTTKFLKE